MTKKTKVFSLSNKDFRCLRLLCFDLLSQMIRGGILPTGDPFIRTAIGDSIERENHALCNRSRRRGTREHVLVSAPFFPKGKEERDHSQCDQYSRDGESGRRDFGTRVKTLFLVSDVIFIRGEQSEIAKQNSSALFFLMVAVRQRRTRLEIPGAFDLYNLFPSCPHQSRFD
jgi:hypothetical protein